MLPSGKIWAPVGTAEAESPTFDPSNKNGRRAIVTPRPFDSVELELEVNAHAEFHLPLCYQVAECAIEADHR